MAGTARSDELHPIFRITPLRGGVVESGANQNPTMKTKKFLTAAASLLCSFWATIAAAADKPDAERIGVYDSRAVAYAHFWSGPEQQSRVAMIADGKAAKAAGDTVKFRTLGEQIAAAQKRSHLQVFSTAPADEAMVALKDKLPAIQRELGVARLVSKWDEAALKGVAESRRVEATDRLVREFALDEKQQKTLAELRKAKPMPLAEAKRRAEAGKL